MPLRIMVKWVGPGMGLNGLLKRTRLKLPRDMSMSVKYVEFDLCGL